MSTSCATARRATAPREPVTRWLRLTEMHAGSARSVFQFNGPGSIAKATHAGLPWLRFIRQRLPGTVHFWPFDGWDIPAGSSVVAEVRPALRRDSFVREGRTAHQHAAFCISAWLARADRDGALTAFLKPDLKPAERTVAKVEGWILGVPGLIRDTDRDCTTPDETRH